MARNAAKEDTLFVILVHPCSILHAACHAVHYMIRQHAMQTECILEIFSPPESMVSHIDTTESSLPELKFPSYRLAPRASVFA